MLRGLLRGVVVYMYMSESTTANEKVNLFWAKELS